MGAGAGPGPGPAPVAGVEGGALAVGARQHRLQPPQDAVGAPVLGELDRRAHQVALVLVELAFEALEQRKGVRRAAGESGEDAVLVQAPDFLRAAFDDDVAEGHLAVAAERHARAAAHGKNGGAVEGFHAGRCLIWGTKAGLSSLLAKSPPYNALAFTKDQDYRP